VSLTQLPLHSICGTSKEACQAPDCQFRFGPACDANKIPTGQNTSTLTRTKVGSIAYGGVGIYPCNRKGDVALTYDDGPFSYTNDLLSLLARYSAKATFFVTGVNNGKGKIDDSSTPWPAVIRRMYADGHQLASHTWSHADLSTLTRPERRNEMYKLEMALRNLIGVFPTYMRPPYSSCDGPSGCQQDMADLGYHITYFDLDTDDYNNVTPQLIQNAKDNFDRGLSGKTPANNNALVIAHDIHFQTVYNLTEYMLQGLQRKGFRAVTVGTCLNDPASNWYRTDTRSTLG
jgi:peptidoglycan/xylan/chitin deacetylase (PgdA/CDA1 family)